MPDRFAVFLLYALAIMDVAITSRILALGGSELWAPMRWAQAALDRGWGLLKVALTLYAAVAWSDRPGLLWAAIAVMGVVVVRNWMIWRRMRRS